MKPSDELEQLLKNLHLNRILDIYSEQSGAAEKEDVTYSEFLTRLMRAQWHHRQETALAWRIKRASLPENWSLVALSDGGSPRRTAQAAAETAVPLWQAHHAICTVSVAPSSGASASRGGV